MLVNFVTVQSDEDEDVKIESVDDDDSYLFTVNETSEELRDES